MPSQIATNPPGTLPLALAWVLASTLAGTLAGFLAYWINSSSPGAALNLWPWSGLVVAPVQWLVLYRRLRISPLWIMATAVGSFLVLSSQLFLGYLITMGAYNFDDLLRKQWDEAVIDSVILVAVGTVFAGLQSMVLLRAQISWKVWLLFTVGGVLAMWFLDLYLWSALSNFDAYVGLPWPRGIEIIVRIAGGWAVLAVLQSAAIALAPSHVLNQHAHSVVSRG